MRTESVDRTLIEGQLRGVISPLLCVPVEAIHSHSRLFEDLNMDSFFIAQLALALEEEFGILVDDSDLPTLGTVASVVDYIVSRLQK